MSLRFTAVGIACMTLTMACGSARKSEPFAGTLELTDQERRGEEVFMRFCNECHPQGEGSVGPSIHEKPLPGDLIELQVRQGLGSMPAFGEDEISDADLDALVAYLGAKHAQETSEGGPSPQAMEPALTSSRFPSPARSPGDGAAVWRGR